MGSVTRNRSLFMIRETALHWSMKRHMMIVVISGRRKRQRRRIDCGAEEEGPRKAETV